jgi:hypothetical protein
VKLTAVLRAVSGSSTLQITFTAPNFRTTVGDALRLGCGRDEWSFCMTCTGVSLIH